ncbi:hypothetical protein UFOVP1356_8 [uncultured Caudovirales phage]|uniref:Uncharacterized protein n=1 Tax=uncultured Caudovirales phage TaxID=2100421 RepID=A0A6J5S3E5_9CAUD|nr:hypothetical protein UFOVP1356_8 [uncultured Caudovirales phage]
MAATMRSFAPFLPALAEPHPVEEICSCCSGSGEGQFEGTTCRACGGSGIEWVEA